jgi:hypothetical protein
VEPGNAYRAGTDLVDLLLRVSLGETPAALPDSREGVVTHLAMQALLGCASGGGTRRDIIGECWQLWAACGAYAGSTEELTPVRLDWVAALPLGLTAVVLLASPKLEMRLTRSGFGAHLLDVGSIRMIEREDFPP